MSPATPEMDGTAESPPGLQRSGRQAHVSCRAGTLDLASIGKLIQSGIWTPAIPPRMPRAWDAQ